MAPVRAQAPRGAARRDHSPTTDEVAMTPTLALTIASVCLYSTGHWIGATVLLAILAAVAFL